MDQCFAQKVVVPAVPPLLVLLSLEIRCGPVYLHFLLLVLHCIFSLLVCACAAVID